MKINLIKIVLESITEQFVLFENRILFFNLAARAIKRFYLYLVAKGKEPIYFCRMNETFRYNIIQRSHICFCFSFSFQFSSQAKQCF